MEWDLYRYYPDTLEKEWNELLEESICHVPFLRHEYLKIWWQTLGGGEWGEKAQLNIVTARRDGRLVGVAPLFFIPDHDGQAALMLLGSIEISDYLDLIVRQDDLLEFSEGLLTFLAGSELPAWQSLDWYNLLDSSPTLKTLQESAIKKGWQTQVRHLQHSPFIPLPGNFDTYLAGIDKKQRHEIRRKMRRAEEAGRGLRYVTVQEKETFDQDVETFLQLMAFDPQKETFLTPPMREQFRRTVRCAFDAGCLHMAFLEIDGEKAAGHMSFDYLKRIWAYNSGVNPKFNELSPGWVLLGYELQWANQNAYSEYDFMRGDEEYKYRFGAVDRSVMRLTITR
ncbi:MAG: GNAT family N-acetyltransferase [Anaerolineae bacterium]|nr:GNAT family N-acetyltransferase [Anaerolineae bacterium]